MGNERNGMVMVMNERNECIVTVMNICLLVPERMAEDIVRG